MSKAAAKRLAVSVAALEPGYELDVLIAKMMGGEFPFRDQVMKELREHVKRISTWGLDKGPTHRYWNGNARVYFWAGRKGKIEYRFDVDGYSSDHRASFSLVDFMRRDGFSFKLSQPSSREREATVSFVCQAGPCEKHGNPIPNHHGAYDVDGPSVPAAICKAALVAKGCL